MEHIEKKYLHIQPKNKQNLYIKAGFHLQMLRSGFSNEAMKLLVKEKLKHFHWSNPKSLLKKLSLKTCFHFGVKMSEKKIAKRSGAYQGGSKPTNTSLPATVMF